ncbi:type 4a pilus biogenesis protein PilO [bacterium]|nr:type 4a pilus biogenesis protein PilO [bacterium]
MALTPQERNNLIKVGIIVLAVVAASIFAPGFGVNDTRTKIAALDKKLAEAEKTLADMKETAGRLKSLQDQYNRLRPEIEAQERRLPRTSNYDELFRHLNMLGAKNNIRFDALEGITDAARAGVRGEAQEDKATRRSP